MFYYLLSLWKPESTSQCDSLTQKVLSVVNLPQELQEHKDKFNKPTKQEHITVQSVTGKIIQSTREETCHSVGVVGTMQTQI